MRYGSVWISRLLLQDKSDSEMIRGLHFSVRKVTLNEKFIVSKQLFGPFLKNMPYTK